jgi:hypothetical protein
MCGVWQLDPLARNEAARLRLAGTERTIGVDVNRQQGGARDRFGTARPRLAAGITQILAARHDHLGGATLRMRMQTRTPPVGGAPIACGLGASAGRAAKGGVLAPSTLSVSAHAGPSK